LPPADQEALTARVRLYVSSYAVRGVVRPVGIHHFRADLTTGSLTDLGAQALDAGYSFCAWSPTCDVLYATSADDGGSITGFAADASGWLLPVGRERTQGDEPCHISVHPDGRWLFVSNFGDGSISVHPIDDRGAPGAVVELVRHSGRGPDLQMQGGPHVHATHLEADVNLLVALEFGGDEVVAYHFDGATGGLSAASSAKAPSGAAPRHLAAIAPGRYIVTDELSASVTTYDMDLRSGRLSRGNTVAATAGSASSDAPRIYPSEVQRLAAGRFAYVANRGVDVLTQFDISGHQPRAVADFPCGGSWPRHFAIVGGHMYVANQRSDSITALVIDPDTGSLGPPREVACMPSPVFVLPSRQVGQAGLR
jgi:6-phosphogluconolactonase